MNKIFTLIALGMVCLYTNVANAQVTEDFSAPLADCWLQQKTSTYTESSNGFLAFANNDVSALGTPYIKFTTGIVNIKFHYRLNSQRHPHKTRTIQVGYQDGNGTFTPFHSNPIEVTSITNTLFTSSYNIPNGSYRIVIKSNYQSSNEFILIDNYDVSGGSYHYSTICNPRPVANNDTYYTVGYNLRAFEQSLLANDTDDDNEALSITIVQPSPDGTITLGSDGTFSFKPYATFNGTTTTFTYTVTDNGLDKSTSLPATVTIHFSEGAVLPVSFLSFSGHINDAKAVLNWGVADNQTGSHFTIEKSTDAKTYQVIATQFVSDKSGQAHYTVADAGFNSNGSFYRIKAVNKDGSHSYSKTIYLRGNVTTNNQLTLMQNPVRSQLSFSFTLASDETAEIAVYNLAGVKLYSQKTQARKGTNSISLDITGRLATGNYILTIQSVSASRSAQFVKQ